MDQELMIGSNNGASILFGRTGDVIDGFLQGSSPSFTNYINYVYYYSPNKTPETVAFNGNLNQWERYLMLQYFLGFKEAH